MKNFIIVRGRTPGSTTSRGGKRRRGREGRGARAGKKGT